MKVQEKMKTYGSNTLTDSELISLIIGKRVKDRTAVEVADKVMESLPRQNLYYLGESSTPPISAVPKMLPRISWKTCGSYRKKNSVPSTLQQRTS